MTKTALLQRYAAAKFAISLSRLNGDERTAALHTKYALDDIETDFKARARNVSEKEALEVLAMDVEDMEAVTA
jgi:hypothetical protein